MKEKLEKIVSSVKEAGRNSWNFVRDNAKILTFGVALAVGGYFVDNAKAGNLRVYNKTDSFSNGSSMYIQHIGGATEAYDESFDLPWSNSSNTLHIYSNNPNSNPNLLQIDAKDPNSTTTFNTELLNNGFSGTANNYLRFRMCDSNNFEWKNIFLGDADANDSNNIVADVKYVIISDGRTYLDGTPYGDFNLPDVNGTDTGVYDKRKIIIRNHADLNRDRKVNGLDFVVLGDVWGKSNISDPNRFGSYVGADVNDLGAYADIDRNGSVDFNDVGYLNTEWLYNADDPNSW